MVGGFISALRYSLLAIFIVVKIVDPCFHLIIFEMRCTLPISVQLNQENYLTSSPDLFPG